nr:hypothetical protein [Tanacetum cinerariifolium]
EGQENVINDSSISRNDEQNNLDTRLEPRRDKESLEIEITDVVIPVNVNKEEEEINDEVYELKRREKGKIVEESRNTPFPTPIRFPMIYTDLVSLDTEKLQELKHFKEQVQKQVPEQVRDQVPVYVTEGLILERQKNKGEIDKMIAKAILQECGNIQA